MNHSIVTGYQCTVTYYLMCRHRLPLHGHVLPHVPPLHGHLLPHVPPLHSYRLPLYSHVLPHVPPLHSHMLLHHLGGDNLIKV